MSRLIRFLGLAIIVALPLAPISVSAEETRAEKAEAGARNAKVKSKKTWRKAKKNVRDATGSGSVVKDAKDTGRNVGDAVEDTSKNIKNKVD